MTDADYEYWSESLGEAFDRADLDLPSDEQWKILVEALKGCAEVQHECMGRDRIPNPLTTEISRLQESLQQQKDVAENREYVLMRNIASRYGYPEDISVEIRHGHVFVEEVPR